MKNKQIDFNVFKQAIIEFRTQAKKIIGDVEIRWDLLLSSYTGNFRWSLIFFEGGHEIAFLNADKVSIKAHKHHSQLERLTQQLQKNIIG